MTTEVDPGAGAPGSEGTPPGNQPDPKADPKPNEGTPREPPKLELEETPPVEGLEAGVVYDPTGNTGLDMALEFVGALGFGPEHATMKAAETGDFGPLKEAMAKLGDKAKGWQKFVKLGEEAYAAQAGSKKAAADKLANDIANAVGGKETWDQVRTWASANASPEEKAEVNAAFAAGGVVAKTMAKALYDQWIAKAERSGAPVKSSSAKATPGAVEVMTAADYQKGVAQLAKKYNGDLEGRGASEYAALQNRRLAALRVGK